MAHPQDTTTLARLDKTCTKVLCGYRLYNGKFCDGRIATVELAQGLDDTLEVFVRLLYFGPGWVLDANGVWHESRNAHRRRQRGYAAKYRTAPGRGLGFDNPTHLRHFAHDGVLLRRCPLEYPAYAACPHCNRVQVLDLGKLRVDPPFPAYSGPRVVLSNPDDS